MIILYLILLLFALLIISTFAFSLHLDFLLDSESQKMQAMLFWLYPLLKIKAEIKGNRPFATIWLFGIPLYSKPIQPKPKAKQRFPIYKSAKLRDIRIDLGYGLTNPFETGIACFITGILQQLTDVESFEQRPDFLATEEYIYLKAKASVNPGMTVLHYFNCLLRNRKNKGGEKYGSVQFS